ncbi:uncharacterized protein LOC129570467 [Sitodiplosis mosellana]|uniref:uncharacterized protein LOC129570467 n=1 Tax=Sitodiplosis mosellana TaxID=263140 RepID=UPI0024443B39|nr:uncharacterized protein LOC129570467 [Sitodiplosis mosellana]
MDESTDGIEQPITSNIASMSGSGRKRGHQHHIRNSGTRPSTVRADEVIAALRRGDQLPITQTFQPFSEQLPHNFSDIDIHLTDDNATTATNKLLICDSADDNVTTDQNGNRKTNSSSADTRTNNTLIDDLNKNNRLATVSKSILIDSTNEQLNKRNVISRDSGTETLTAAADSVGALHSDIDMESTKDELNDSISSNSSSGSRSKTKRSKKSKTDAELGSGGGGAKKEKRSKKTKNLPPAEERPPLEGADADQWTENDSTVDMENDPEAAEWSKLRCTSERAEVVAEREYRRQNRRCADYPGLAFGRSIFSSDTMMKLNIIRNELHNIMKTQLKRVCVTKQDSTNLDTKWMVVFLGLVLYLNDGLFKPKHFFFDKINFFSFQTDSEIRFSATKCTFYSFNCRIWCLLCHDTQSAGGFFV